MLPLQAASPNHRPRSQALANHTFAFPANQDFPREKNMKDTNDAGPRDIAAPRSVQSALPTDERLRLPVETVNEYAIFMLDISGNVVNWNTGAQKMKGYSADEIVGRHFSIFHRAEDIAASQPAAMLAAAVRDGWVESEGWRVRRDGSTFPANVVITAIRDASGTLYGFAKVTQNLTGRKRVSELEQLGRLTANLQAAREEEQARIARELHDDLGQQLTALKMALARLESQLDDSGANTAGVVESHTQDMHRLIDTTVVSLRRIATGLRPIALETLGLIPALESLIDEFTQRYRIAVKADIQTSGIDLSEAAEVAIFHIVQEALTNVARHAEADEVVIELGRGGRTYILRIEDNGQGSTHGAFFKETSFGLLGMRERVHRLNGTLSIDSAPGCGFRIAIAFPLVAIERGD
jgi:PAS domain S-box-containing protein